MMKQIIFRAAIFVGLFSFVGCYAQQPEAPKPEVIVSGNPEMRGYIKIAGHTDTMPQFRVVYAAGKETMSNSEGFFTFPIDDSAIEHYSLVICKRLQQNFDKKNTLKNVSVVPDKEYRLYSFKNGSWIEQDVLRRHKNFVIPPHGIVLLVDPKCVESVTTWNIDLPSNIIKLPMITLTCKPGQKDLKRIAAKSLCYSLDATTFHEPVREKNQKPEKSAKVAVSRVQ